MVCAAAARAPAARASASSRAVRENRIIGRWSYGAD
jgi:hypothetical protein